MTPKFPTEAEIRKMCRNWQRALRLQDWKIAISYGNTPEMVLEEGYATGFNQVYDDHRESVIKIKRPEKGEDPVGRSREIELTIIHELLHIPFYPLSKGRDGDEHVRLSEETAINQLAEAFLTLRENERTACQKKKAPSVPSASA